MNVLACDRWLRLVLAILAFAIGAIPVRAADNVIALKAARLFDGKSKSLVPNGVVIVRDDKVVDVGSNLAVPADAQVIDLGDATLAPGFMDAHTHLTLDYSGDYNVRRLGELDLNVSEQAIIATGTRALLSKQVSLPCAISEADSWAAASLSMLPCAIRL